MSVAGIALAAGSGTRFGGPKALAVTGDRTWLEIVMATLLEGGCRPVVVVLGASASTARAGVRMDRLPRDGETGTPDVIWVVNNAWADGRAGSLQCGLQAIPPETTGVLVHAVDHPEVRPETVAALAAAHQAAAAAARPGVSAPKADFAIPVNAGAAAGPGTTFGPTQPTCEGTGASIFLPVYRGHRGHPVLLSRAVWPEVLALAPDDSLRTVVHRDPARLCDVEVDDPGIHRNRNERESGDTAPAARPEEGER